jgi:polyisoprenoid-binding protein YceI
MKIHLTIYLPVLLLTVLGCQNDSKPTVEAKAAEAAPPPVDTAEKTLVFQLDPAASTLYWEGYEGLKLSKSEHNGSLAFKNGSLSVQGKMPVAGKFTVDIQSLKVLDIPATKPGNAKLTRHLLNEDFFDAAKFPEAIFEITGAAPATGDTISLSGNLTLRGVTKSITFPALVQATDSTFTAVAPKFYINRKDWNMHYKSEESLGDELIRPEMGISLSILAKK